MLMLWLPKAGPLLALFAFAAPICAQVNMEWVTVDDPGNAADVTGLGAVAETFLMAKHEVTNLQYAAFLNAVARTDPNGLYNPSMSLSPLGGISRKGRRGQFEYTVRPGRELKPVPFVSFGDAI